MHLMVDLETLSTAVDAAFMQVGISPFKLDGDGPAGEGLSLNVDPQACIRAGLRVDWSTVHWWMNQSREARDTLPKPGEGLLLSEALRRVSDYVRPFGSNVKVWSNGAAFDIPILENAFLRCGIEVPWKFYNVLDVRTVKMLHPRVPRVQPKVAHNALSDAEAQAVWVQRMLNEEAEPGRTAPSPPAGRQ